jgi:hypothetical protein
MVHAAADGTVYAFLVGVGLMRAKESDLKWEALSGHPRDFAIIHLAIDPANSQRMFAVRQGNAITVSNDGGRTWAPLVAR